MNIPVDTLPWESLRTGLSANDDVPSDPVAVFKKIMTLTFSVLRSMQSEEILDKVAVVRGYAELWIKYPEISIFRQRMADSLNILSNLLKSAGANESSDEARWCAQFAGSQRLESGPVSTQ